MTESDLLSVAAGMIANPPIDPKLRETLLSQRYKSGDNYLDAWRNEIKRVFRDIASEKSWVLQKQHLLKIILAANSWIALSEAVGNEQRSQIWKSYVENIGEFAHNTRDTWFHLLKKSYLFACLQHAVCFVVGMACYGIRDEIEHQFEVYRGLRKHLIEKDIALGSGIFDLMETHARLAELMIDARNRILYPIGRESFDFVNAVGDRITSGTFRPDEVIARWPAICERENRALAAMQAEVETIYTAESEP
jgi:hypothetical protein